MITAGAASAKWPRRIVAVATWTSLLGAGVLIGLFLNSVIAILKFAIVLLLVSGVPVTLNFIWRRVTQVAVFAQVFATLIFIAVIPWVVSSIPSLAQSDELTLMTRERVVTTETTATAADVAAGLAKHEGQTMTKTRRRRRRLHSIR